jgi:hypothetical protein
MSVFIPKFVVIKSQQTFTHSWHWNCWTVSCWTNLRLLQESPTQVSHLLYHIENLLKLDGRRTFAVLLFLQEEMGFCGEEYGYSSSV